MNEINIVFPNQLFENSPLLENKFKLYLIEEDLFFKQYKFHKQKIYFHRSSMLNYANFLKSNGLSFEYVSSNENQSNIKEFIKNLPKNIDKINVIDPDDNWLEKKLINSCKKVNIKIKFHENISFITTKAELHPFFRSDKKKLFQTSFYKAQRLKLNVLLEDDNKPVGGKWTYDDENRLKYPKEKKTPIIKPAKQQAHHKEVIKYVNEFYSDHYGELNNDFIYPTDFKSAKKWFDEFLNSRFHEFGPYEDAVLKDESILNHSILSPLMNSGLLDPKFILNKTLDYYKKHKIPINSCEGFIRQIIGWREFIRGVYHSKGSEERTKNFWGFKRKIPKSFYDGTTGIEPLDDSIKKILKSGYANHIERLMIVGNFMLLCEFDPDEVYKWFMELFIDAYDWVMVPNVYGMSQFADGGIMSTKPYISGSNYIIKMSNYKKGEWSSIWDALFWNFMDKQREFFLKNPRMRMLISSFDKMDQTKKENYLIKADAFLKQL